MKNVLEVEGMKNVLEVIVKPGSYGTCEEEGNASLSHTWKLWHIVAEVNNHLNLCALPCQCSATPLHLIVTDLVYQWHPPHFIVENKRRGKGAMGMGT